MRYSPGSENGEKSSCKLSRRYSKDPSRKAFKQCGKIKAWVSWWTSPGLHRMYRVWQVIGRYLRRQTIICFQGKPIRRRGWIYIPEMIIQCEIIVIQRLFKLFISIFMDFPLHHKSFGWGQKIIKWFYSTHISSRIPFFFFFPCRAC